MVKDTTFDEEQINRFKVIDNKLVIPGIDNHTAYTERGYYYELKFVYIVSLFDVI